MRILFAGTPLFAKIQLEALAAKYDIVAVYTQADRPAGRGQKQHESEVKVLAKALQLPIEQPLTLKDPDAVAHFKSYQPDVLIVAAYGLILPKTILDVPKYGCINVHASLLPRWRGASPIQQAILHGDNETGITLMRMNEGLDTGNILAQQKCVIAPNETAHSLHDKLAQIGAKLLTEKLDKIVAIEGDMQNDRLATHAKKINKQDAKMNWQATAVECDRAVRAYNPWPIAFSEIDSMCVRIWQSEVVPLRTGKPGTIVDVTPHGILVATKYDGLLITKAQLPGKNVMPFADILHGHAHTFAINNQFT